jgi:hypothetical protein
MYELRAWTDELDLSSFYEDAKVRGFENNCSQRVLIDCFQKEKLYQVWILYYNGIAVGSVASHSFPEMGENAFRICARTCIFTDKLPRGHVRNLTYTVKQHQNLTAQFFIPACVDWAGRDKDLYITSNMSPVGSQRLVHTIYCPALVETGALVKFPEIFYRGNYQTPWRLDVAIFLDQLNQNPRWELG